jgi:nickel-type superoxide dismutase maturation protease
VVRVGWARVHGRSMAPTLHDGDRLLVLHGVRPSPGAVCVVRLPDGTLAVKRLARREDGGWWIERDNPREGVDSWRVGVIPEPDVVAVAVLRAWPRPRRLRRRPG